MHAMAKPLDVNPLTWLWRIILALRVFDCSFLKYFKLVEIAMVQMFGSVKNEQCFNFLAFCKFKLHNRFTTNLNLVVIMFS